MTRLAKTVMQLTIVLGLAVRAAASDVVTSGLEGTISCSLTGAKLPADVGQPPEVTYTGSMELVADGSGKFVSGHMITKGAGDTAAVRESRPCQFNLISGKYTLGADGTGQSVTSWAYWEGGASTFSDQLCSDNVFHPQKFEGLDLNNLRKERNRVVEALILPATPKHIVYWIGMDETGLTLAVCKRQPPQ